MATTVLPFLYLGPRASASRDTLFRNHITDVLSIGSQPPSTVQGVTYHRLSLLDDTDVSIREVSEEADSIIESVRADPNRKILVHCSAAISRSPTIVVAYLMKHHSIDLYNALGLVVQARPPVCPNPGFLSQLKEMEMELYSAGSLEVEELPRRKQDRLAFFADAGQ
ncbi:hypothetical protein TWF730_008146 [Orbilia blumenaviensis]|uniref:protein-tyrosine-phosphatase n=1 Tax=Orbilia blumenaviensis TaxID=1796055 RepID=A0AAV9V457_9PEZI